MNHGYTFEEDYTKFYFFVSRKGFDDLGDFWTDAVIKVTNHASIISRLGSFDVS